jgi:hypothetical protein
MARQEINVNAGVREFEAYMDFSGGMNNNASNERLADNEFTLMQNVDLNKRGSVKKRTGRTVEIPTVFSGTVANPSVQGVFFFNRQGVPNPDMIFAVSGKLYYKLSTSLQPVVLEIPITGLPGGFQTDRVVEAVQFYQTLYVATGTKLVKVEFNASGGGYFTASVAKPYEPNSQEIRYIGLNALLGYAMSTTNDSSITQSSGFEIKGIIPKQESTGKTLVNGLKGERIKLDTYIKHNTALANYNSANNQYQFFYRVSNLEDMEKITVSEKIIKNTGLRTVFTTTSEIRPETIEVFVDGEKQIFGGDYILATGGYGFVMQYQVGSTSHDVTVTYSWKPNWFNSNSNYATIVGWEYTGNSPSFVLKPSVATTFDFKVQVLFAIGVQSSEYVYERFDVKTTRQKQDVFDDSAYTLHSCNRIRLHWDRLMLFGDTSQPTQIYISELGNGDYYPVNNTLRFDTGKQEDITTVVRVQDFLTVFTPTTIHTVSGKSPDNYQISLINNDIGCIAPLSAVLTGNVITFLSEEGVFALQPNMFKLEQMNVARADLNIKGEVPKDTNACAINYDSQYWLCYPNRKIIYRFYYESKVWVKDISDKLNFVQFIKDGDNVYNLAKDAVLYKHSKSVYKDGNSGYNMIVESKYFDLSKSFNFKKLKRLYMLARAYNNYDVNYNVYVYADSAIVLTPETGQASINQDDYVVWTPVVTPNVNVVGSTVFGLWELGEDAFGDRYLDVQKARIQGKCRRVKVRFENDQDQEVEIFGFGLEFKLKKP